MAKRDDKPASTEIVPVSAERADSPVAKAILEFVSRIPESDIPRASKGTAEEEARRLANAAANKAALTAGSLALPPGPLGWLTVLPELVAIWRIQGQLVSDIAAAYGKTAKLGREQMLWCLFRHTAAQAFRDIAIRVGDRLVFRTAATSVLQRLAGRIGVSVSKRAVGKGISRWLPIVGALGVGAYAYYDTGQVAKTAIDLFSGEIHVEGGDEPDRTRPGRKPSRSRNTDAVEHKGEKHENHPEADAAPKARRRSTTKPAAPRKRATAKKSVARKSTAAKVVKSTAKKATKKVAARRAPAKKAAGRKNAPAT
jgi:hypothetical protein